jgi:SAM-dependent methyltransferase
MRDRTDLATWHRVAANEKADSIIQLSPAGMERIVDIGCGSGAILEALDQRNFGGSYWGCEPTTDLYEAIPADRISRLVEATPTPFEEAFLDEPLFDLGIMAHVAEHLRTPAVLIAHALERCRYVLVEVPIEDNACGMVRTRAKQLAGRSRLDNVAGHVQFFSRRTARALIHHSGGKVIAERPYFPIAAASGSADHSYQRAVVAVAGASNFFGRRYYEHFAMIATAVRYENWQGHYIAPR